MDSWHCPSFRLSWLPLRQDSTYMLAGSHYDGREHPPPSRIIMSLLQLVPPELVDFVCEQLSAQDLLAFRQICKDVREKTFACFLRRFFQTRAVTWERRSLLNLVNISQHPILVPAVQTLNICCDQKGSEGELQIDHHATSEHAEYILEPWQHEDVVVRDPHCRMAAAWGMHQPRAVCSQTHRLALNGRELRPSGPGQPVPELVPRQK